MEGSISAQIGTWAWNRNTVKYSRLRKTFDRYAVKMITIIQSVVFRKQLGESCPHVSVLCYFKRPLLGMLEIGLLGRGGLSPHPRQMQAISDNSHPLQLTRLV